MARPRKRARPARSKPRPSARSPRRWAHEHPYAQRSRTRRLRGRARLPRRSRLLRVRAPMDGAFLRRRAAGRSRPRLRVRLARGAGMSRPAENTLHPLEIEDAREAAYRASELQRDVEDAIRDAARDLAEKERLYRRKLSKRIVELHAEDGYAITMCGDIARGEEACSDLRYERDVAEGVLEAARQQ